MYFPLDRDTIKNHTKFLSVGLQLVECVIEHSLSNRLMLEVHAELLVHKRRENQNDQCSEFTTVDFMKATRNIKMIMPYSNLE